MPSVTKVLFVQAQGIMAQGGSSKIFRALTANAPLLLGSLVCGTRPPAAAPTGINEWFVRERTTFGRLERTRLSGVLKLSRAFSWAASCQSVKKIMSQWQPLHVHAHLHGIGFIPALDWCRDKGTPFSISIHDDIRHLTSADPWRRGVELSAAEAWLAAANRFVISAEIGEEYSRRYGKRPWTQITDGLTSCAATPRSQVIKRLNIYFAGAVNIPYEPNFHAMQAALGLFVQAQPTWQVRFIARGGRRIAGEVAGLPPIEVRPFGSPSAVAKDMDEADLLYLPLSLDRKYSNFARFSLSTKMITYLGAGLPIFYHGPRDSAVYTLLARHNACIGCFSNDPEEILVSLTQLKSRRQNIVQNALDLGRKHFRIGPIRERFWSRIIETTTCTR